MGNLMTRCGKPAARSNSVMGGRAWWFVRATTMGGRPNNIALGEVLK